MRFLSDDELPNQERERRAAIRKSIARLIEQLEDARKHAEPALLDAAAHGDYDRERALRSRAHEESNKLRRKIKELQALLPPYTEMAEGDVLIRRWPSRIDEGAGVR